MDPQYHFTTTEAERAQRRAGRIAARKQRQRVRRRALLLRILPAAALALLLAGWLTLRPASTAPGEDPSGPAAPETIPPAGEPDPERETDPPPPLFSPKTTAETVTLEEEELTSGFAVLIDVESEIILAQKNAFEAVNPASMTKILTILVAAEHIESLDGSAVVTQEVSDYCFRNRCSVAGFLPGEEVKLEDLFYGAILPSGADAALTLAGYVSGSEEAFVSLMNEKASELGLSARFAGCVGLYDPDTQCSVYDMARILKAALDNDLCRRVLSQRIWEIPPAGERETELSNWFIRRIEDHMPQGFEIQGAKTGFVTEAGNCAASCARSPDGRLYLCVTAQGAGIWPCIYDHVALYESVGAEE